MDAALAKERQDVCFCLQAERQHVVAIRRYLLVQREACLKKQLQESSDQLRVRLLLLLTVGAP